MAHLMRLVDALPLQIGVGVSIVVTFMFSQSTFFLSLVCLSVFVVKGVLLGSMKVFRCHWWDVKL